MKHSYCRSVLKIILMLLISQCIASEHIYSQFISKKKLQQMENDLSPSDVGVKYIYSFPVEKTDVRIAESGREHEIPDYDNESLIVPVMEMVLSGRTVVYDPNFWGEVYELKGNNSISKIDTPQILKYLGAGPDTALLMDVSGNFTPLPTYTEPDIREISGIFFMEHWLLNIEEQLFHKEIIAYLPIRDYFVLSEDEQHMEKQRRLLFMVLAANANDTDSKKMNPGDFISVGDNISFEQELYNKAYSDYIYRNENQTGINQAEYEAWEYHHFDFYKFFNRKLFLDVLLKAVMNSELPAYQVNQSLELLSSDQIDELRNIVPDEINSIIFTEDWYLHPGSLVMEKVVNSIVLVRHIRDYDDYTKEYIRTRKVPLLMIKFEQ